MLNKATCKCIVLPMGYATQMENAFAMISGFVAWTGWKPSARHIIAL